MAGVDYHTIKTFYDELSKYPSDMLTLYSPKYVSYISVVFSSETEQKHVTVTRNSAWNNLHFYYNVHCVNETVGQMLMFLKGLIPTDSHCTVTMGLGDADVPRLIVPGAKQILFNDVSTLHWCKTHINTYVDLEKYKKEINMLSDCCDGDEVLISKWIEKKISPTLSIYRIENKYYLAREDIIIDYPSINLIEEIFVESKVNPRIKVCLLPKSTMDDLFKKDKLKELIKHEIEKMKNLSV